MLLMVEKGIRRGISHAIYWYAKANSNYMKHHYKNGELLYPILEFRYFYGWAMSQKLSVNKFEWIEDASKFNGDFIRYIMRKVMKDIFSELMFNVLKSYISFIMTYHFYQKEWKSIKSKSSLLEYVTHIQNSK